MRYTSYLLKSNNVYPSPSLFLPQPYDLFNRWLLKSHETPRHDISSNEAFLKLSGVSLFQRATGLKTSAYAHTLWKTLSDAQRLPFESPPPIVLENLMRIDEGYEKARLAAEGGNTRHCFHHSGLYPWEIIKDKLRQRPAYAQDVYDQLIQEALTGSRRLATPKRLHENWLIHNQPEDVGREKLTDIPGYLRKNLALEASWKNKFAERKHQFRRAQKSHTKGRACFKSEYSEAIGKSMSETRKDEFISEQWKALSSKTKGNTVISREIRLETDLAMVMDYIFEYGDVWGTDIDWREWRQSIYRGSHYLHKTVFPYIVNITGNGIDLLDSLPAHLEWSKPSLFLGLRRG